MWPRVALRCTSCKNRHIAASALLTARRGASASAGDGAEGQQQHQPLSTKSGVSSPSAASPSAGAAGAEQLKGSRFQRSNNNASSTAKLPPSAANGDTAEQADKRGGAEAAPVNVDILLRRLTVPHDFRTQPSLFRYLQRLQVALRVNALFIGDAYARCELHKVLLPSVQGVDIEIVVLILQTLQLVDADASSPLLHDAVAWLSLYTVNMSLAQCLKVVELLQHFQPALAEEFMRWAVQRLQPRDIPALSATQTVVLLTSLLQRLPRLVSLSSTAINRAAEAGGAGTGGVGHNAEHSSADAALLELAASLRDRCKDAELLAVPADHIVQLLRALLNATSSRALASNPQTGTWSALIEATCALLSSPPMADTMSLAASAHLLESLMEAARKRELQTASDASPSTDAAEAEERLTSALVEHLRKAAAVLAASAETSCASSAAVAALPSPWKPRDVREVWGVLQRASQTGTSASPSFSTTTAEALAELRRVLLTYVSTLAAAHPEDNGVTELAFLVARGVVQADRVAAQHARELQQGLSGSMGGAASATDDEVIRCDLSAVLPPALLDALVESSAAQLKAASITWTPAAVADAISLFSTSSDEAHRTSSTLLAFAWYKQLQTAAQGGERVTPQALLAFFTPELLRTERVGVDAAVAASLRRWSVSEVLYFLAHIAGDRSDGGGDSGSLEAASVLRTAGAALCVYAGRASAAQLAALMECFGAARVRSDEFCDAVITRLAELLRVNVVSNARRLDYTSLSVARGADASEPQAGTASDSSGATGSSAGDEARVGDAAALSIAQLTQLLRCFALLEVRKTQPFLDAAPHVIRAATEDRGTAEEVTQLLAAYAKLLIWNYPVYRALAERLCRIPPDTVTLGQLVTAQLALLRMDVTLPEVTTRFYIGLVERYGEVNAPHVSGEEGDAATSPRAALMDIVMHLSLLSRLHNRSPVPFTEPQVVTEMTRRLLKHANVLSCADVAEVLLSLARLGEGSSPAFDQLTMQALGQLPTAPPRVMAHLVEAYALAGRGDQAELFALVADRTVAMRHDMAAVTIASILHSFATAGVRNDRLFIEGIPRVRHVATYGTPRDIVNVVSAYAAVNLWHYKLFAKLADRAVQLRADFRVSELVSLLTAYATVQMRYDTLFTEFAPRIQTLMHLLTPSDLSAIVSSYNTLDIPCPPVWKATAERAVVVVDDFTETEAEKLLSAYSMQGFYNEACVAALTERFPALSSIPFETRDAEAEEGKADEEVATEKAAGAGGEVSAEEQRL